MTKRKNLLRTVGYHALSLAIAAIMIYPLVWLIASSFKSNSTIFSSSWSLVPEEWGILENYSSGWKGIAGVGFGRFILNTLLVATVGTTGNLLCSLLAAYALSRIHFKLSKFWFTCVMITMMVPSQVMVVPQYIIFHNLGILDTYASMIIPWFFGGGFFIFLMVQYFRGIPVALDEAAEIDGCNKLQILFHIHLPLISPALVTSAIFSFYWIWQDFFQPLIFMNDPEKYTVSLALRLFLDPSSSSNYGGMFAMCVLSLLPVIILFICFQKHLVEGIATSGLKG